MPTRDVFSKCQRYNGQGLGQRIPTANFIPCFKLQLRLCVVKVCMFKDRLIDIVRECAHGVEKRGQQTSYDVQVRRKGLQILQLPIKGLKNSRCLEYT